MGAAHILLTKEDVRAAAGWIGFVAIVPIFGATIYAVFGVNRVEKRAAAIEALREPRPSVRTATECTSQLELGHLRQLADVGRRVAGTPILGGNTVEAFANGTAAYPQMLAAIEGAERSIALSTYIFRADRIGWRFVDALAAASRRGVEVRVIIDSIGSGFVFSPIAGRLRRAGIPVAMFSRDIRPWRLSILNLRNHKKLLVVDGRVGFVGGLNLGEENENDGADGVQDTHFALNGPVVEQLLRSFTSDLSFATGEELTGPYWWPTLEVEGTAYARGVSSGPDGTIGSIAMLFAAAVTEAEERVRIVTPYFLPDQALSAFLRLAVLKGVRVEVVLPEASDQVLPHWAMQAQMRFMQTAGIRFHLGPSPFDHSKLFSVDGRWCAFGSPNWDPRSLRLNFEFLVEVHDADVTACVDTLIDAKVAAATPLDRANILNAPLSLRLRDAAARLMAPYL